MQKSPTDQFFQEFIIFSPTRNIPPLPPTQELHHPKPVAFALFLMANGEPVQQLESRILQRQPDQTCKMYSRSPGPFVAQPATNTQQTGVKRAREVEATPEPTPQTKRVRCTEPEMQTVNWKLAYHALRTEYTKTKEHNASLLERIAENERRLGRLRTSNAYLASLSEWLPRLEASAQHYYTSATLSMDRNLSGLTPSCGGVPGASARQPAPRYTFPASTSTVHASLVAPPSYMTPPSSVVSPTSL